MAPEIQSDPRRIHAGSTLDPPRNRAWTGQVFLNFRFIPKERFNFSPPTADTGLGGEWDRWEAWGDLRT